MKSALTKAEIESVVAARFPGELGLRKAQEPELLPTGIAGIDSVIAGLPRGAITEICGPASSGRTSLLVSILAQATGRREVCAYVDTTNSFDPSLACRAGVDLNSLLWVNCGGSLEHALKAADLLVHAGGFGVVALDMADVRPEAANSIPLAHWFRMRRAIEHTPSILAVIEQRPNARNSASMILDVRQENTNWTGRPGVSQLFRGAHLKLTMRKPPAKEVGFWKTETKAGFQK